MDAAIRQARVAGIPVHAIAFGGALTNPTVRPHFETIAKATGGVYHAVVSAANIGDAFERIAEDLAHGYYLAFRAAVGEDHEWHKVEVVLRERKDRTVRTREGYFPD